MTWLEREIRRVAINRLILCAIIIALCGGFLALNYRYLSNYLSGPHDIARSEMMAITDPTALPRYWVATVADNITDTGLMEIGRRLATSYFYVARYGDRLLLVKTPSKLAGDQLVGLLRGGLVPRPAAVVATLLKGSGDKAAAVREQVSTCHAGYVVFQLEG